MELVFKGMSIDVSDEVIFEVLEKGKQMVEVTFQTSRAMITDYRPLADNMTLSEARNYIEANREILVHKILHCIIEGGADVC